MSDESPKLGYLPDPEDYEDGHKLCGSRHKDWDAAMAFNLGAIYPSSYDISDHVVSVLNQGSIGSCVAAAGMQAIRMCHVRQLSVRRGKTVEKTIQDSPPPLGSRLWGYWLARSYHGMQDFDTGTHIRSFFRAMNKFGFLAEKDYPYGYNTKQYAKPPPPNCYRLSFDQRKTDQPLTYYRIFDEGTSRFDLIKRAIFSGYPVEFGVDIAKNFLDVRGYQLVERPTAMDEMAGGHAMVIVGYGSEGVKIVNSWGTKWGDKGYGYLSWEYVREFRDIWVVKNPPNYVED